MGPGVPAGPGGPSLPGTPGGPGGPFGPTAPGGPGGPGVDAPEVRPGAPEVALAPPQLQGTVEGGWSRGGGHVLGVPGT